MNSPRTQLTVITFKAMQFRDWRLRPFRGRFMTALDRKSVEVEKYKDDPTHFYMISCYIYKALN